MADVTEILSAIEHGDPAAAAELLPLVYNEFRKLAASRLARERPGQTLDATSLVHDAYLRLVGAQDGKDDAAEAMHWDSKGHFFAAAAEAMRRILVERARRKTTIKHGGKFQRVDLEDYVPWDDKQAYELLALDETLTQLELHDAQAAQIVKLRYFAGMSHGEAAAAMQISRRTADRLWALAKARLYQQRAER